MLPPREIAGICLAAVLLVGMGVLVLPVAVFALGVAVVAHMVAAILDRGSSARP